MGPLDVPATVELFRGSDLLWWMSGGAEVLEVARAVHPMPGGRSSSAEERARTHREEVADAYRRRRAECFVTRPAGPQDERFNRAVAELLDEWWRLHGVPGAPS